MPNIKKFELEWAGRQLAVEFGRLAEQANSSCLVSYGQTVVLATAVMGKEPREGVDFLPFQVEMVEKMYAAGKIKGSRFVKREGRPTDNAILDARMIDRGIRPLFNQNIRNEIQTVVTTLSYDEENPADVLAITAAAIALHTSDIPWAGPLVGLAIGRVEGQLIVNPTLVQLEQSDFKLVVSVVGEKIIMVDADFNQASEEDVEAAFALAIKSAQPVLQFIEQIRQALGKPKQDERKLIEAAQNGQEISLADKEKMFEQAKQFFAPQLDKYLFNQPKGTKRERKQVAKELLDQFVEQLEKADQPEEIIKYVKNNFEKYLEEEASRAILERELRIDGRRLDQIRPLDCQVGILPRTHGTGLFSRGETQVLSVVTLGAPGDAQILDEMTEDDTQKRYLHFYNSPPYSFGEAGPFRSPGRREIGHGALAEKALLPVLPEKEQFPYTIMVVSEVMGSNGSSSMASTCGSTLALMDAGVPIKSPVAGVAMGLASKGDQYKILTDLQDMEDGDGGMDFKVAGTTDGITAIQMDTKTNGLSLELCRQTLAQAKRARLEILAEISKIISAPRSELSPYAPRIETMRINPEKIRDVIGTGGKIINEIIAECNVQIDIEDDGLVTITSNDPSGMQKALKWVDDLTREIKVGEVYTGPVVRLMDFGAFVQILPGRDGMVHISEFANHRVDKISDVVKLGDTLTVKVIEIDSQGRVNLSVKQADPNYDPASDPRQGNGRPNGRNGNDRRDGGRNSHDRPRKKFGFRR